MIEPLLTVDEVAALLGESSRYVRTKCRQLEWPHRKGSRGTPKFSTEDVVAIRELIAVPVDAPEPRVALAPRSRRGAARNSAA